MSNSVEGVKHDTSEPSSDHEEKILSVCENASDEPDTPRKHEALRLNEITEERTQRGSSAVYQYKDYSNVDSNMLDEYKLFLNSNKTLLFPMKLHIILSRPECKDIICWFPVSFFHSVRSCTAVRTNYEAAILELTFFKFSARAFLDNFTYSSV